MTTGRPYHLREFDSLKGDPLSVNLTSIHVQSLIGPILYPVGSIYMSTVATNPATLFGFGIWVAFGAGRVPVGIDATQTEFDVVEEIGGEKTHTLSTAELAIHNHSVDPPGTLSAGTGVTHTHTYSGTTNAANTDHYHSGTTSGPSIPCWVDNPNQGIRFTNAGSYGIAQNVIHTHTVTTGGQNINHNHYYSGTSAPQGADHTHTVDIAAFNSATAGSGSAHNNLQPYIVVYMWKRTA